MNKDKRNNIQLLGTLNNADESGIIANANQIYDANEDKSTQDVSKEHKERIETLETKESSMQTTLENITKTGEASAASNVTYNHNDSKLDATNVQQAVDKVKALLDNKANKVDVVFDISAYHATGGTLATYDNLEDALGTNGENIPQSLRKGGMFVKFVQTSDNKYVLYRLMAEDWSTTVTDWQGVDSEPTTGSDNLVKSGGVYTAISKINESIYGKNIPSTYYELNGKFLYNNGKVYDFHKSPEEEWYCYLTGLIDISSNTKIIYSGKSRKGMQPSICFYSDANDTLVGEPIALDGDNILVNIPKGALYFRAQSFAATNTPLVCVLLNKDVITERLKSLNNSIDDLNNSIDEVSTLAMKEGKDKEDITTSLVPNTGSVLQTNNPVFIFTCNDDALNIEIRASFLFSRRLNTIVIPQKTISYTGDTEYLLLVFKLADRSFIIAPYQHQKNYNSQEYIILCRFGYDKSASNVCVHSLIGMSSYIVNGVQYNQVISQKDITDLSTSVQQNTTDITDLSTSVQQNTTDIEELKSKDACDTEDYVSLYYDNMKSISNVWEQPENGAGFTFDSNGATPNAIGETTYIRLKKIYHSDKRYMRIGVKMGIDTKAMFVMSWSWNNQQVINVGEGASCFAVDFSNKKLLMYAGGQGTDEQPSGDGYDTSKVIESVDIPQEAIGSRDYIIEIHKDGLTSKLILMDKLSGVHVEVAHTGWAVGRQNQYYGFYCESGTLPTFHDIDVESLNRPDIVFVGDSITEGVYVNDRTQRYAEKFRSLYPNKKIVISARGGDYANGVLWKFPTEFNIYRPKAMSLLIGANGGNTEANLTQIKQKCDAIGCKLYIHHCTCQQSDDSHIEKNRLIDSLRESLDIDGANFDIATAKEYYPFIDETHESPRYKPSLYGDNGLHPNVEGNAKMFERLLVDTPSLFYNTTSSK